VGVGVVVVFGVFVVLGVGGLVGVGVLFVGGLWVGGELHDVILRSGYKPAPTAD
jgi:membrane protein DedA with SNARE-associated domain